MSHYPLTEANQGWACKLALKWSSSGYLEMDDAKQQALLGMMEAEQRFDPGRGVKFITYATTFVERQLRIYLQRRRDIRYPPRHQRLPDMVEIDACPDELGEKLYHGVTETDDMAVAREKVLQVAAKVLNARERWLLLLRYGHEMKLEDVGKRMGISCERVRQIEAEALERIRLQLAYKRIKEI